MKHKRDEKFTARKKPINLSPGKILLGNKLILLLRIRKKKKKGRKKTLPFTYTAIRWKIEVFLEAFPLFIHKISPLFLKKFKKFLRFKKISSKKFKAVHLLKPTEVGLFKNKLFYAGLFTVFSIFFLGGVWFWQTILKDLPSANYLSERQVNVSTKIYDRNGEILYTIYKDVNRTPLPLSTIPMQVRLSTIVSEDSDFYNHSGFSLRGIIRAIYKDLKEKRLTGGSTITQQLVKNALLTPEKTLIRKIKEFILAIEVERKYSKDQILEMYLNEVPYGGTAYGIQEASKLYFNKNVADLTIAESALLAGLPQSPTSYSPFGASPESAIKRQKEVLRMMQGKGYIDRNQYENALNEKLNFAQNKTPIKAPHFVFFARDYLENKYGKEIVEQGGLSVITTLDYQIQKLAESVVGEEIEKLKGLNVTNAAVLVLNPQTGEILAMVGSEDFFDIKHDGNVNVVTRLRQPGSSIKVVNYAYALSNGLTAATIIPDTPVTFKIDGQPDYSPKNYEGEFRGNITLRSALAESRNIPAVKVLSSYGVKNMIEMGTGMGITSWKNPDNYGLSLTLGGGDTKLIDLTQVYATIANYGLRPDINPILKVADYKGQVLEEYKCTETNPENPIKFVDLVNSISATDSALALPTTQKLRNDCKGTQVLDPRVAYIITDILKDNNARSPSFGTNSLLVIKNHPEVAVKTGTSNDLRDNLAIGYNQNYVVAVWIGNNDNSPMSRIASGVTGATPIFNKIMSALLSGETSTEWLPPQGLVQLPICPFTGTLACEGCPMKMEWFLEENKPEKSCTKDWFNNQNISITPVPKKDNNNGYFERIFQEQIKKIKKRGKPE